MAYVATGEIRQRGDGSGVCRPRRGGQANPLLAVLADRDLGAVLRQMARDAGLYTAADGDPPSQLIGLEVLCGGKFGETGMTIDIASRRIRSSPSEPGTRVSVRPIREGYVAAAAAVRR